MREIAPLPELSRLPGMPASLEGFLNLAGEAVMVIDLARLFGVAPNPEIDALYRHVLIVQDGAETLGLLVDRVEDVRRVEPGAIRPAEPTDSLNGAVIGEFDVGEDVAHLLSAGLILLAAEKARMADLRRAEQARLDGLAAR